MDREHRILFTGTIGVGKSTAVANLLDAPPVRTTLGDSPVPVAIDHGDLRLDNGDRLRLYGTPGQRRFEPTWRSLADGAIGLIVLVDPGRPDPLADLAIYLENFTDLIHRTACVVGIARDGHDALTASDATSASNRSSSAGYTPPSTTRLPSARANCISSALSFGSSSPPATASNFFRTSRSRSISW